VNYNTQTSTLWSILGLQHLCVPWPRALRVPGGTGYAPFHELAAASKRRAPDKTEPVVSSLQHVRAPKSTFLENAITEAAQDNNNANAQQGLLISQGKE